LNQEFADLRLNGENQIYGNYISYSSGVLVANQEQVDRLKLGVKAWNEWRSSNPEVDIDLYGADFSEADFSEANFIGANFRRACLKGMSLSWADFFGANLTDADLTGSQLFRANLRGCLKSFEGSKFMPSGAP
jgi:uncharacterized protein YjbI with pentapeptide repeats